MAKCVYCGKETQLHVNGVPTCLACLDAIETGRKPPDREEPPTRTESKAV